MEEILSGIERADKAGRAAQTASENPPPDPGFARRVRALAQACDEQGQWLLRAAQTLGFEWKPLPGRRGMTISHELRPGANRPGPPELWQEFDRAVERLGVAMEGQLMYSVAWAYRTVAETCRRTTRSSRSSPTSTAGIDTTPNLPMNLPTLTVPGPGNNLLAHHQPTT
jgi:hypothetical protein